MRNTNSGLLIAVAVFLLIALTACNDDSPESVERNPDSGVSKLHPSTAVLSELCVGANSMAIFTLNGLRVKSYSQSQVI